MRTHNHLRSITEKISNDLIEELHEKLPEAKRISVTVEPAEDGRFRSKILVRIRKKILFVEKISSSLQESIWFAKKALMKQYERKAPRFKQSYSF